MPTPHVSVETVGKVLVAHLDDGKANALSADVIGALLDVVDRGETDPDVGALVLHGRAGMFCAGFDLGVMRGGDGAATAALVSDGGALVHRLYGSGLPVIAACTGHALAAGALILLGCDVRIGADIGCKIGLNEVAIGMVLPNWAITIAQDRLSTRHVQRAIVTGQITDAAGAVHAGFLDETAAAEDVLTRAMDVASSLAELPPRAYAGTVRALRGPTLDRMASQIADDRARGTVPAA